MTGGLATVRAGAEEGYVLTKSRKIALCVTFVGSLVAVSLLFYFLAGHSHPPADATTAASLKPGSSYAGHGRATTVRDVERDKEIARLPRKVVPNHYNLRLLPVIEKGNFSIIGQVAINVECREDTYSIFLHSVEIDVDVDSVQVVERAGEDGEERIIGVEGLDYEKENEFLAIRLGPKRKDKLTKGRNYTISMNFVGELNDKLRGFYRSSYHNESGVRTFMASSQMQPTDARRAFPCFDEPALKATFSVTLGRRRDMVALSNMPLIKTIDVNGTDDYVWDEFEQSRPMSTYLVAFVVADFVQVPAEVNGAKWNFSVYARQSARNQTQYARSVGPKMLAFFEDYFNLTYPLPKLDMVGIPDFAYGAMENYGCVTFRESMLLYDDTVSSLSDKQLVVRVVAHELAHQWFGNLVTAGWWSDLWLLNEGLTSYAEHLASEHVEPDFQPLEQMIVTDVQEVMKMDSLPSSLPLPKKGSSILRMLAHTIGAQAFREGLINYLHSHQYGNTVPDNLWEAFNHAARANRVHLPTSVSEIMKSWTYQMGFPVVNVTRNYQTGTVSLSQERFLMKCDGDDEKPNRSSYHWWIRLTYTSDFETVGSTWMNDNHTAIDIALDFDAKENQWLVFNVNQTGLFRVNYDSHNWQLLTQQLVSNHSVISVVSRAQIMDDALNLARASLLDYETALSLTLYLVHETEFLPWEATLSSLSYLSSMMSRSPSFGFFKKHIGKIAGPLYRRLGFHAKTNDTRLDIKTRVLITRWACTLGVGDCVDEAKQSYKKWMADPHNSTISADLKETIVCTAIREGGETEWEFAFKHYTSSSVANEQAAILSALSCSRDSWILTRMLEMSVTPASGFRRQDFSRIVRRIADNELGRYLALDFIRQRWSEVEKTTKIGRVLQSMSESFNTQAELNQLVQISEEHKIVLTGSIDRTRSNLEWMKQNYPILKEWLQRTYF